MQLQAISQNKNIRSEATTRYKKVASSACKFIKTETLAQVFSCQFLRNFLRRLFFYWTPWSKWLIWLCTCKTTCCLGGCSIPNELNLKKLGIKIHNYALLLEFLSFFRYTAHMPLFFKVILGKGYQYFYYPSIREEVVQRCSVKKVFLEISQNSQENTFARVSF